MQFSSYRSPQNDSPAVEFDRPAARGAFDEVSPNTLLDAKALDEFLLELQQGDDLLELEDFFSFSEQELDV